MIPQQSSSANTGGKPLTIDALLLLLGQCLDTAAARSKPIYLYQPVTRAAWAITLDRPDAHCLMVRPDRTITLQVRGGAEVQADFFKTYDLAQILHWSHSNAKRNSRAIYVGGRFREAHGTWYQTEWDAVPSLANLPANPLFRLHLCVSASGDVYFMGDPNASA